MASLAFLIALYFLGWIGLQAIGTELDLFARLGIAYGLGAGIFSFALFLAFLAGLAVSIWTVLLIYCLLLGAMAFVLIVRHRSKPLTWNLRLDLSPLEIALLGTIVIVGVAVLAISNYWPPYDDDTLIIWLLKAKLIVGDRSLAGLALTGHPFYPLNLPLQLASVLLIGAEFPQVIFPIYFFSLWLLIYSNLRQLTTRRIALAGAVFLAATPLFAFQSTRILSNIPFAFYYCGSAIYLVRYLKERNLSWLVLSALFAGLTAWTRSEALLYLAINLFTLAIFLPRSRVALKTTATYLSIFVFFWLPWTIYGKQAGLNDGDYTSTALSPIWDFFAGRFDLLRLAQVLSYAQARALDFGYWGLLWITFPLAALIGWRKIRDLAPLVTLMLLNFIGVIYTYYAAGNQPEMPLSWWLYTGFDRMAMHWTPLIVFFLGLVMNTTNFSAPRSLFQRVRIDPYLILLLFFSFLAIGPLLGPGYFWGAHDGRHSVYFLFEFDRAIQDGVWYPRWAPDFTFGFGYPFFNIYAPGAFYVSEFLHLLGFDFVTATKIVFALAIIFSGPAMFAFVKRLTNSSQAAFLSGLVYVYIPYHIVDIYVRAALAELVALIFLPLTLLGFYEAVLHPSRKTLVLAALAYGAMHFTHNGIALLFTPVLIAWILFLMIGKLREQHKPFFTRQMFSDGLRLAATPFLGALLGVGLAAIFVLPAVLEFSFVRTDQWLSNYYDYTNHFAYLFQLFSPFWDFGISVAGPRDQMSFQLGVVPVLLAIFAIFAILKNPNGMRRYWIFFLALTFVTIGLMLSFSLPLWEMLRLVTFAQFPWRLLTLTNVSLAILAGAIALHQPNDSSEQPDPQTTQPANPLTTQQTSPLSLPTLLLGILIVLGTYPFLTAQTTLEAAEGPVSILGLLKFQQSAGEMTGVSTWVTEIPTWSPMADVYFAGKRVKSKIEFSEFNPDVLWFGVNQDGTSIRSNGETVEFDAQDADQTVTWNIDYYPGWHVYLAEKTGKDLQVTRELPITIAGEHARIQVKIPQGRHWLMLRFEDTPPRVAGMWISAASILTALGLLLWKGRRPNASRQV